MGNIMFNNTCISAPDESVYTQSELGAEQLLTPFEQG